MDVDISQLQDNDLFMCTGPDGVTYKTEASKVMSIIDETYEPPKLIIDIDNANYQTVAKNAWNSVCWSPELSLFVAVGSYKSSNGKAVMTSSDGENWTTYDYTLADENWYSVCWSPELSMFVATGAASRSTVNIMTSPDGIAWDKFRIEDIVGINSVTWAPELSKFVAVVLKNPNDKSVESLTSTDGRNWIVHRKYDASKYADMTNIVWAPGLNKFLATHFQTVTSTISYSTDGIIWNRKYINIDESRGLAWSEDLQKGVMTCIYGNPTGSSTDGLNWKTNYNTGDTYWRDVIWIPEARLFFAVAIASSTTVQPMFMTSENGEDWNIIQKEGNAFTALSWSPELKKLVGVGSDGLVMSAGGIY